LHYPNCVCFDIIALRAVLARTFTPLGTFTPWYIAVIQFFWRRLQTLTHGKSEMANKFKDAPIVVGEKVLRDSLNNKIVENFAKKNNLEVHWYHADDKYHRSPLASTLRKRMLRAKSNVTDDAIGMLPLVPGMKVMITDNIAMKGKVANGCIGTLCDLKYEMNAYNQRRAVCAYVHVPGSKINAPGLPIDVVPVLPATK